MDNSKGEAGPLTCPLCSEAELWAFVRNSLRCGECGGVLGGAP
jgi:ribosomal protein S27AE